MTEKSYYSNPLLYGNYQYVYLNEIINDYLANQDSDDYDSVVPRYKILYHAKQGIKELYSDVLREIRAIQLKITPLLTAILPPDYVSLVRISWVDENNQIYPMNIDNDMSMAEVLSQDENGKFYYDLKNVIRKEPKLNIDKDKHKFPYFNPNKDFSKSFPNGRFNIDKHEGLIKFGSDVYGKNIIIEYISDGFLDEYANYLNKNIRIHKFAEKALLDFIYYGLIQKRRNVPANEKMRAKKEFYNSKRIAKRRINTLRKDDILRAFKKTNKWIKD